MTVDIYRVVHQPLISGPGLSTGHYVLELPALETLEAAFGRSEAGPALYGWMDDERAGFGVREGFSIFNEFTPEGKHASAFVAYDTDRLGGAVNLKRLPKKSFDGDGSVNQEGMKSMLTPLKDIVSIDVRAGGKSNYTLVYSFSKGSWGLNPFFIYVGCNDGEGHDDYQKTLRNISPEYSGLLAASSSEEMLRREISFEDFMQEFTSEFVPAVKSGLAAKARGLKK